MVRMYNAPKSKCQNQMKSAALPALSEATVAVLAEDRQDLARHLALAVNGHLSLAEVGSLHGLTEIEIEQVISTDPVTAEVARSLAQMKLSGEDSELRASRALSLYVERCEQMALDPELAPGLVASITKTLHEVSGLKAKQVQRGRQAEEPGSSFTLSIQLNLSDGERREQVISAPVPAERLDDSWPGDIEDGEFS